jgi:hypothetical protein
VLVNHVVTLVATNCYTADVGSVLLEPLSHTKVRNPVLDLLIDRLYQRGAADMAAREDWRKVRHYGSQTYGLG